MSDTQSAYNKVFVEQSPSAIAMLDTNMCYIAASDRWISDYKLEGQEIIGRSHYDIFPEIGDDWKKIHQRCLKGDTDTSDGSSFLRKDGTMQWIAWEVRPWYTPENEIGGLLMLTNDLTELKNKELESRRIEQILERTSKVAKIGTWDVNLISKEVFWSEMVREIHEVEEDYVPNMDDGINFYKEGESRQVIQEAVDGAINRGIPYDLELELITAKGNEIWVRAIGQSEFVNGQCIRLYGIFQDITEQKRSKEKILEANENLELLARRLRTRNVQLADFVHITSHNLRAPVSNLESLLTIYDQAEDEEEEQLIFSKFRTVIQHLSSTLNTLIEALRAKEEGPKVLEDVDLEQVLKTTREILSGEMLKTGATIRSNFSKFSKLEYDRSYMESIFLNLVSNAIKYRHPDRDLVLSIETQEDDGMRKVLFTDNGLGIDLEKHGNKLFKLNKVFHRHPEAKGVGLFMTKAQIESMGGRITATSEVGIGTTFVIHLD